MSSPLEPGNAKPNFYQSISPESPPGENHPAEPGQFKEPWNVVRNFWFRALRFGVVFSAATNKQNGDNLLQPSHFLNRNIKSGHRGGLAKVLEQSGWVRGRLGPPALQAMGSLARTFNLYSGLPMSSPPVPLPLSPSSFLFWYFEFTENFQD